MDGTIASWRRHAIVAVAAVAAAALVRHCLYRLAAAVGVFAWLAFLVPVVLSRYLPRLRLGPNASVSLEFGFTQVSAGVRDVSADPEGKIGQLVAACLPLPLQLQRLDAREIGVVVRPFAGLLDLRHSGLDMKVAMTHPDDWDIEAAEAAARSDALALVEARLAALAAAGSPPPTGLVNRLLDIAINCTRLVSDDFSLVLEAAQRRSDASTGSVPSAVRASYTTSELEATVTAAPEPSKPNLVKRWSRDLFVTDFALAVRPATDAATEADDLEGAGYVDLLGPVQRSLTRLKSPLVMDGLLSGQLGVLRRIDMEFIVDEVPCTMSFSRQAARVFWGILGEYFGASAWQTELQAALESHRRQQSLSAEDRLRIAELVRQAAREGASQQRREESAEALSGLRREDVLALRWYAACAGAASPPNRSSVTPPSPAVDDATWATETSRLWRSSQELSADQAMFHELGMHYDVRECHTDIGCGAASIMCDGLRASLDLLPASTNCSLLVDTSSAIRARAGSGESSGDEQKTLVHCKRTAAMQPTDPASASTSQPVFEASLVMPTVGPMRLRTVSLQSNSWAHWPNWMNTFFPELSGLLESDPVPPAPIVQAPGTGLEDGTGGETEVRSKASKAEMAAKKEIGYLWGMPLEMDCTICDTCLLLPRRENDFDMTPRGVGLRATQISALLVSGESPTVKGSSAESLHLSLWGAAVTVHQDEYVLQPMGELQMQYEAFWHEGQVGCLERFDVKSPFAQLQVMPQALIVSSKALAVLYKGMEAPPAMNEGTEATAPATAEMGSVHDCADATATAEVVDRERADIELTEGARHAEILKRIRAFFENTDVDSSGTLERKEVHHLVESLCVGHHALTHQELNDEFEKFWVVADATGDGEVSFEEFCHAIGGFVADQDGTARRTCGTLTIRAGDLCNKEIMRSIGASEERLWSQLGDDFGKQQATNAAIKESSEALTLQWKLLRALQNFQEAQYWWTVLVGPRRQGEESPCHPWSISEDAPFYPACDVLVLTLAERFQKAVTVENNEYGGDVRVANVQQRHGYEISVTLAGFKVGLADAMSWLRQQDRLHFGAGKSASLSEPAALSMRVALWRQDDGAVLISEDDTLDAEFSLKDLEGSCMDPFEKTRHVFIEHWGVSAKALSDAGDPEVKIQLVSDQHFVFNLTSSLALDIKPLLQTLYLQNVEALGENPSLASNDVTTWAATPLDHLLRRQVGGLSRDHLSDHCLLSFGREELGASALEAEEKLWMGPVDVHIDSSINSLVKGPCVLFEFELPDNDALTRVVVPQGLEVEHIEFKASGLYQVQARPNTIMNGDQEFKNIQIYKSDRLRNAIQEEFNAEPNFERVQTHQSGAKISKELRLWNCCGRDAKFWFEDRESGSTFGRPEFLADGSHTTREVPEADCVLCLSVVGSYMVMRPDFMVAGKWAMMLHEEGSSPLRRTGTFGGLVRDAAKSIDALPKEALSLCTELVVNNHGRALLKILPPVELRNATQHALQVELVPPSGEPSVKLMLRPGGALPVPLPALRGPSWSVRSTGAVAHAFMLSKSILEVGKKQSAVRRALGLALESHALASAEYQSELGSAISSGRQATRYTLLMLPELRVVNSLPVSLKAVLHHGRPSLTMSTHYLSAEHGDLPEDKRDLFPGTSADYSLMGLDFRLELSASAGESSVILVTSGHMQSSKRFCELSRDLQLGSFECSIQCSWAAGAAPEVIVYGKYVVFNKTGLPLTVRSAGEFPGPQQTVNDLAILTASDHEIQAAIGKVIAERPTIEMPTYNGSLQLRCTGQSQDSVFTWLSCEAVVSKGTLVLKSDEELALKWALSELSTARAAEVYRAGGEVNAFSLEDPKRADNVMLKAACEEDLCAWLKILNDTIEALRLLASTDMMSGVWNSDEGGKCQRCAVPAAACGAWSKAIPVQAPVDGEAAIEVALDLDPQRPSSYRFLFLGVQVQPLVGALGCSSGITFTPRFVVQNRTGDFLQVLPAILSTRTSYWPKPVHAVLAKTLLENHRSQWKRSHPANLLDQTTSLEEGAVWVAPGESAAMFHFPLRCDREDATMGHKAVSLRLAGRAPLQVIEIEGGTVLDLERVGSSFMPYTDKFWHFGPLPQVLRGAVQSGHVRCMVGPSSSAHSQGLGELALTATAEVFVAVRSEVNVARWLKNHPWETLDGRLDLRHKGECVATFQLFRRHVVAGSRICLDGAGAGSVLLFEATPASCLVGTSMTELSNSRGLPWSAWVQLETTGEELHELEGDESDNGHDARFVRCSVQVKASTAFLVLSDEPAPYRVENWSLSRTLAIGISSRRGVLRDRRVLPPLSWSAFSWPEDVVDSSWMDKVPLDMKRHQRTRKLVVHDIATESSKAIEIDDIGRGTPLILNEDEDQRLTGETAPLSEFGFRSVVLQNDPQEMAEYIGRVCAQMNGSYPRQRDMAALSRQCMTESGTSAFQSLRALRNTLLTQELVPRPELHPEDLTELACKRAILCEVSMVDFLRVLLRSASLVETSVAEVRSCADWCCAHSAPLQCVMDEALTRISVRTQLECDAAYELAASTCNAVVLEFFLRYACREAGCPPRHCKVSSAANNIVRRFVESHREDTSLPPLKDVLTDCKRVPDPGTAAIAAMSASTSPVRSGVSGPLETARAASFSEEGYLEVIGLGHVDALELFIRRVISADHAELLEVKSLRVLCDWMVREQPEWTLERLRRELDMQDWIFDGARRGGARLLVDRWYDGPTKVLSLTEYQQVSQDGQKRYRADAKAGTESQQSNFSFGELAMWDIDVQLAGLHLCIVYDPKVHALGTGANASDAKMEEILAITADHFRLRKQFESLKVEVCLHHFQIDTMRERDQLNPIVLAPADSGFHVDRRDPTLKGERGKLTSFTRNLKGERRKLTSFIAITVEIVPSSILHFRELTFIMQPVVMRLEAAYWMELGELLFEWMPDVSETRHNQASVTKQYIEELCSGYLEMPEACTSLQLVYFEHLHIGSVVSDVEILVRADQMRRRARAGGDVLEDVGENAALNWSGRGHSLWLSNFLHGPVLSGWKTLRGFLGFIEKALSGVVQSIGGGVLSGIGHITPKFSFPDLLLTHEFGDLYPLIERLQRSYGKSAIGQCWKVFGSTNILGDPIGLGTSVTGGVVQFFRKTGTEFLHGDLRGEGVKALAQGVIGGTFGHAGKFLGALGDTVDALVDTGAVVRSDPRASGSVDHVGDGIRAGASAVAQSVASGIKGVVIEPIQGFQERGVAGLAGGAVRGVAGVVAKPISGLLHGAQHIAEGVDATTHLWDRSGRLKPRRAARSLVPAGLQPLVGIEFSRRISICIDRLSLSGRQARLHGATYQVELRLEHSEWRKSTQLGRLAPSGVIFQEVHWLPTQNFLDNDLILEVKDKALSGHASEVLFIARVPCKDKEIHAGLSELLRFPAGKKSLQTEAGPATKDNWQPLERRWRPAEAVRVHLRPVGAAPHAVDAALLLRFWPAWDPETVPRYQRYHELPALEDPEALHFSRPMPAPRPPACQGYLEKRTKGMLNHWSLKWVVVENHRFQYWDDKRHCDRGYHPKVRYGLTDPDCPFRFAAGNDPEKSFVQMLTGNEDPVVEARWRPYNRLRRRDDFRSRFRAEGLRFHSESTYFHDTDASPSFADDGASTSIASLGPRSVSHGSEPVSDPLSAAEWLQAILQHSIRED